MKNLILSQKASFKEAIKALDKNGNGFLAIVDEFNKLIGILTDGDIRRAILDNETKLTKIINKNPETMPEDSSRLNVINQLKKSHKKHMPIIDNKGILKDVIVLSEGEFNLKPNWVVIMAGGLGTRLGELTKDIPKPMLEVGGKPVLLHIMELFACHGFTKFFISVNFKAEIIKNYFKNGKDFGMEIIYLEETKRLGTGGALGLIQQKLDYPLFVTNGDIITSIDYDEMLDYHKKNNSNATMAVRKSTYQIPYGVIETDADNNILSMKEKPEYSYYVNTGTYILNPEVLSLVPKNEFYDLPRIFEQLQVNKEVTKSYEITHYWLDMGSPEDYKTIKEKFDY